MTPVDPGLEPTGRGRFSTYSLIVLLATAASIVWVFLTPLGAVPDEPSHVQYAAAIVRAQTGTQSGSTVTIPAAVANGTYRAACTAFAPLATTRCQIPITPDSTPVTVGNPSAGYPPLYFAVVGLPTLVGFNETVWYSMRLISVALGIGLLAVFIPASRRSPPGWLAVGALLALTPMATYMLASVNPNGAEIFAGLSVAVGIGLLLSAAHRANSDDFVRAAGPTALALSYLILARPKSYLLAAGLLAVAVMIVPRGTAALARESARPLLLRSLAPLSALVAALAFDHAARHEVSAGGQPAGLGALLRVVVASVDDWVAEMIGIFGWRDFMPPAGLAFTWLAAIAAVVVIALAAGSWRARTGLTALVIGGAVVAPTFVLVTVFPGGAGYQGRYQMPLTVGIPILAAAVLMTSAVHPGPLGRRLATWLPWGTAVVSLLIWGGSIVRYSVGLPPPPIGQVSEIWTWWLNPVGTLLVIAAFVAYVASAALISRRLGRPEAWDAPQDHRVRAAATAPGSTLAAP